MNGYYLVYRRPERLGRTGSFFPICTDGGADSGTPRRFPLGLEKAALEAIDYCRAKGKPIRDGEILMVVRVTDKGAPEGAQIYIASVPNLPRPSVRKWFTSSAEFEGRV